MLKKLCLMLILSLAPVTIVMAGATKSISYQGVLTDANNNARPDSTRQMWFKLYGAPTGGSPVWSDSLQVATRNGVFSATLGAVRPIGAAVVPDSCWIAVAVGAVGNELAPRQRINAAVYAIRAGVADSALKISRPFTADTAIVAKSALSMNGSAIAGNSIDSSKIKDSTLTGADINKNSALNVASLVTSGNVGVGGTDPQVKLYVNGKMYIDSMVYLRKKANLFLDTGMISSSTSNLPLSLGINGNEKMRISANGNVGIGTTTPSMKLNIVNGVLGVSDSLFPNINARLDCQTTGAGKLRFTRWGGADSTFNSWIGQYWNPLAQQYQLCFATGNMPGGSTTGDGDSAIIKMTITEQGNVGIGCTNPGGKLVVNGNILATSATVLSYNCSSDRRFKQNITPLDSSLSKINSLQGVTYTWDSASFPTRNFPSGQQIGLIAQDVEKILPQLVHTDADGYKSLSYDKLTAVLIEAVKELKAENKALSTIVSSQQENIGGLLQRIQSLEAKQ